MFQYFSSIQLSLYYLLWGVSWELGRLHYTLVFFPTVLRYPLWSHFPIFPQPFFVLLSYGFSLWNFYSSPVLKEWLLPTPGTPSFSFCEVWSKIFKPLSSRLLDWCQLDTSSREGNGTPLQYSCLENPMDGGAWEAAVDGVAKSQTRLSDFTFTFHFYALEKEMATHSSVLAWRIPGMGSHRVGHDWSDLAVAADTSPCWWIFSRVLRASKRTTDSSPTRAVLHVRMKRTRSPSCDPDQKRIRESCPLWQPIFITCLLTSLERTPDSWQGCCLIPREKPKWFLFLKHGFASLTRLLKNLLVASHCNW